LSLLLLLLLPPSGSLHAFIYGCQDEALQHCAVQRLFGWGAASNHHSSWLLCICAAAVPHWQQLWW